MRRSYTHYARRGGRSSDHNPLCQRYTLACYLSSSNPDRDNCCRDDRRSSTWNQST